MPYYLESGDDEDIKCIDECNWRAGVERVISIESNQSAHIALDGGGIKEPIKFRMHQNKQAQQPTCWPDFRWITIQIPSLSRSKYSIVVADGASC